MAEAFDSLSSKADLYDHMKYSLQYYMVPYEMFTKVSNYTKILILFQDFAKEIFKGNKRVLKLSDLKQIEVKRFDELSVKNLYKDLLSLDGVADYFPDKYSKGR